MGFEQRQEPSNVILCVELLGHNDETINNP